MDIALFDFDGTITDQETMPGFMHVAVRRHRLLLGKTILLPLILGYKMGIVSGTAVRAAICLFGFRRVPVDELEAHGLRFAQHFLPGTLRPEAMDRIAWHKARGDKVVVVSGGLDVYLRHWAQEHGVDLVCSALEQRGGRLTGFYQGRQCVRAEKARLVRAQYALPSYSRVFAYGDTPEDRELLAMAHEPYYRWQPAAADQLGGR